MVTNVQKVRNLLNGQEIESVRNLHSMKYSIENTFRGAKELLKLQIWSASLASYHYLLTDSLTTVTSLKPN